jgi:hypothetical protein
MLFRGSIPKLQSYLRAGHAFLSNHGSFDRDMYPDLFRVYLRQRLERTQSLQILAIATANMCSMNHGRYDMTFPIILLDDYDLRPACFMLPHPPFRIVIGVATAGLFAFGAPEDGCDDAGAGAAFPLTLFWPRLFQYASRILRT